MKSAPFISFSAAIMTWVSSEWSKFPNLQVPFPSAASTSALFEIDFEPGVASLKCSTVGGPGKTRTAGDSTLEMISSGTPVARSSRVFPIRDRITIFLTFPAFFLSTLMMSNKVSTLSLADFADFLNTASSTEVGRP